MRHLGWPGRLRIFTLALAVLGPRRAREVLVVAEAECRGAAESRSKYQPGERHDTLLQLTVHAAVLQTCFVVSHVTTEVRRAGSDSIRYIPRSQDKSPLRKQVHNNASSTVGTAIPITQNLISRGIRAKSTMTRSSGASRALSHAARGESMWKRHAGTGAGRPPQKMPEPRARSFEASAAARDSR